MQIFLTVIINTGKVIENTKFLSLQLESETLYRRIELEKKYCKIKDLLKRHHFTLQKCITLIYSFQIWKKFYLRVEFFEMQRNNAKNEWRFFFSVIGNKGLFISGVVENANLVWKLNMLWFFRFLH